MIRRLAAHPSSPPPSAGDWNVEIQIEKSEESLELTYRIRGNITTLELPPRTASPARADNLWQGTCCEAFFRRSGQPLRYLEFNFSPSGDWAFYDFREYRDISGRPTIDVTPRTSTRIKEDELSLDVSLPWSMIEHQLPGDTLLEIGIPVIFKHREGTLSYWAVRHPVEKPDFHHPDSFFSL